MLAPTVLTFTFLLDISSSEKTAEGSSNFTISSSFFLKTNLPDTICTDQFERIVKGLKSISKNPSTITIALDKYDEHTNQLISLFFTLGTLQITTDSSFSSNITFVFMESYLNSSKFALNFSFWKPAQFYLIFIKHQNRSDLKLLPELWEKYSVYNVFLINCNNEFLVSFNPLSKELENLPIRDISKTKLFDSRFHDWKRAKFYFIYPGKLKISDDGKRTPKTQTYDDLIIKIISSSLNAEPVLLGTNGKEYYGSRDGNGTYIGTYKWLVNGSAYMTCGAHFLKWDSIDSDIPFSHYITMEKLCFTVPAAGQVPHFKAIFKLLNVFVMSSILLLFLFAGLIYRFLRFLTYRTGLKKNLSPVDITLSIVSLLLGMPFHSRIDMTFERIIIGSMLLMNFVITLIFHSTLTTILSKPVYYKKIENKEELEKSGVEIWSTSKDIMENLQKNGYSEVNFKLKPINTVSAGFSIGWMAKVNTMLDTMYLKYRDNKNYFTNECPNTYSMVYFFNKGLPSKNRIDHIISSLIESGHMFQWVRQRYEAKSSNLTYEKTKTNETVKTKPLTLEDMKYIFIFFYHSLILSVLVFIIEIISNFTFVKKFKRTVNIPNQLQSKFKNRKVMLN